ncbi:putative amino acid transporter, transmembrane domain-containing protein [Helianthus annuus]|uniref:Amino acid transporter, transmembrane domain-containing protein n=1 Tax=Helianthus annuus TaxID=4232 RepID=A0A9K3I677_HELAN|nr:putative amino acid transporter, transmembrane domain-containing protein [Helianthus annuus]KAJ0525973.1 putative amino acid transporter, transmembrane domain-containing protein [Helianthus annuus]KAJ0534257.1 putative amino acid transporter, transmembrane domain-containing protein [Helianthus annuus]KAJ0542368.1 putative amino acid transporter, transmembrane domain-containing protein [Helianthus annuus]KAJ0707412.1 putative amino acid transporter, transmembrane domain-containing protein [He
MLVISWVISLYTLWQMVQMHEIVPGKQFDQYHELGQYAFGEKLGLYIVFPQQLTLAVRINIVYLVIRGKSLQRIYEMVCNDNCRFIRLTYFIVIVASVNFVLSHLPSFNSISVLSLAATVASIRYSAKYIYTTRDEL